MGVRNFYFKTKLGSVAGTEILKLSAGNKTGGQTLGNALLNSVGRVPALPSQVLFPAEGLEPALFATGLERFCLLFGRMAKIETGYVVNIVSTLAKMKFILQVC